MKWHENALTPGCRLSAGKMAKCPWISSFYLAGGTALALVYGHRVSVDLDFFSYDNPLGFPERQAMRDSFRQNDIQVDEEKDGTVQALDGKTHLSFFRYSYPLLHPLKTWEGLQIAHPVDIGLMKIGAIIGRGSQKDFFDLFVITKRDVSLSRLLFLARKKFPETRDLRLQACRALVYFADADREPLPKLLMPITWPEVKRYFEKEVRTLSKSLT